MIYPVFIPIISSCNHDPITFIDVVITLGLTGITIIGVIVIVLVLAIIRMNDI